ncbi:MAG: Gfo/Idh/MocA family oxidoreductase, partial [Christensenella sp.]|nr:Gfo/Idh/MocA family oxidoreductase [Christensenella sp.]
MERVKTAIIGCGSISNIYMESFTNGKFSIVELVACSDLDEVRMRQSAEKYALRAMSLEEILADASIELVINLTTPAAHYPINKRALLAGKHVFSEKMIAVELDEGRELVALANEKGLRLG